MNNCPYLEKKCEDISCPCPKYYAYKDACDPEKVKAILEENHFDTSLPPWELMYSMQMSFESRFHEIGNLSKEEIDYWIDKNLICIEDEIREVRECLDIYGKNTSKPQEELKKEVIDILHFMMDLFICGNAKADDIKKAYFSKYKLNGEDLIETAYKAQSKEVCDYLNISGSEKNDFDILKAVCKLSDAGALVRQQISWKYWKKPNDSINMEKLYDAFAEVFHEFINLCLLTLDCSEIKDTYIKKNVENIQRQFYGY